MEILGDLKIKKELWDLILSGKKDKEFRKLSSGLVRGTYKFVSIEYSESWSGKCIACQIRAKNGISGIKNNLSNSAKNLKKSGVMGCSCRLIPKEIYGTAHLTPIELNNKPHKRYWSMTFNKSVHELNANQIKIMHQRESKYTLGCYDEPDNWDIDDLSAEFVIKNYVGKHDFLWYGIDNVKGGE